MPDSTSPAGIAIPVDRIIREMARSAHAGFFGRVEISISLTPEVLKGVTLSVRREHKLRSSDKAEHISAADHETERERSVTQTVNQLKQRLQLSAGLAKIVGHFQDGRMTTCEVVDQTDSLITTE